MLKVEMLNKYYVNGEMKLHALKNINFEIGKGEYVAIMGSSGSGKSTMMNAIAGVFYVDEGSVILGGKDITFTPEYKRSRVIGRLFQDPLKGTAPHMTIEENLALAYLRTSRGNAPFSRVSKKDKDFLLVG